MDSSRTRFGIFLGKLAGEADLQFSPQWLRIGQQKTTGDSIVDGFIAQDSIKIAVETKRSTSFSRNQLEHHLQIFKDEDHRLLLLLCPSIPTVDGGLENFRQVALKRGVEVLATSFERIVNVMREVLADKDDEMLELVRDFEEFCSSTGILPDDRYFMFTPPCGPSHADNEELQLYYCPAERSRRNAAFLGIYARKEVRAIGRISKSVVCEIDLPNKIVTVLSGETITTAESARILEAAHRAPNHGWNITSGHRFFLCNEWVSTRFRKSSPNGIQGHRMLDLRKEFDGGRVPETVEAIAKGLDGRNWNQ